MACIRCFRKSLTAVRGKAGYSKAKLKISRERSGYDIQEKNALHRRENHWLLSREGWKAAQEDGIKIIHPSPWCRQCSPIGISKVSEKSEKKAKSTSCGTIRTSALTNCGKLRIKFNTAIAPHFTTFVSFYKHKKKPLKILENQAFSMASSFCAL